MMSTSQFLKSLMDLNITLWLDGDKLRFRAPAEAMTNEIKQQIKDRKPDLIELLRQQDAVEQIELKPVERVEPIPLTYAQQRLWFLDQLEPGVPAYNVSDLHPIKLELDIAALQKAVTAVVERHELLRTVFPSTDGIPRQQILPPMDVPLPVIDLTAYPEDEQEQKVLEIGAEEAKKPFILEKEIPLRVTLIKLAQKSYLWMLSIHHIASDDWSKKLLNQEIETYYFAFRDGKSVNLPPLPIQWADFAIWQQRWLSGDNLKTHLDYWRNQLSGELPKLKFVEDNPRQEPAFGGNGRFYLPHETSTQLNDFCEEEGVTLFMVTLAGYAALLQRYTGQEDFIIGTPISDRQQVQTESLIGFLLNTLPLRVKVPKNITFRELLAQVKETCLSAYSYQSVPYESLMHELDVERTASGNPLFETMMILLNTPDIDEDGGSPLWGPGTFEHFPEITDGEVVYVFDNKSNGTTKFDLSISLIEQPKGMWGVTEYNRDVFDEQSIRNLIENFQRLLKAAMASPLTDVRELPLLCDNQKQAMLQDWCKGPELELTISTLHQFVEEQAKHSPSAIAIESPQEEFEITYQALNQKVNQQAHYLVSQGVKHGERVGVLLPRSIDLFVSVLAVLKVGATYVPLDITCPGDRMQLIIADADIKTILSCSDVANIQQGIACQFILLDELEAVVATQREDNPNVDIQPEHAACILYTSGSTGRPKGVELSHLGIVNYTVGGVVDYDAVQTDRILQFASIAFDASLEEAFIAFAAGATLVLRPDNMLDSTEIFIRYCQQLKTSMLVLPTAYWHEIISTLDKHPIPPHITRIVIGGERAIPEKFAQWQQHIGERVKVFNTYGPTEGSIAITRALLPFSTPKDRQGHEISIGRPVSNSTLYVLDPYQQPVPQGIAGEVYLGGYAVANGYLNSTELTDERFVDVLLSGQKERLYRTGDLARFLPDGTLHFLGRIDEQVKIRGNRVEPGEIEALLQEHEAVSDVIVVVREDQLQEKRLAAYFVANEGKDITISELRAYLRPILPSYMIPADFVKLDALPLNINGKVDKKALPEPDFSTRESTYVAPESDNEKILCDIWQTLLGKPQISVHDNFFELGGHSLLATRIIARIKSVLGIDLSLRRLFEAPTISELALVLDELAQGDNSDEQQSQFNQQLPPISVNEERAHYPLAFAQHRLWFLHQMDGADRAYNIPVGVRLKGQVEQPLIHQAMTQIFERHEALRTVFIEYNGVPVQKVLSMKDAALKVLDQDLSTRDSPESALRDRIKRLNNVTFDMTSEPLIRAELVKLAEGDSVLLLVMHHIVADHWSVDVLIKEFKAIYYSLLEGAESTLPPLKVQFRDYAIWQHDWFTEEIQQAHSEYWRQQLEDAPSQLQLASDYPRPPIQDFSGSAVGLYIDTELTNALRTMSRRYGISLYMTMMTAWSILLHKLSGENDIVIGTPSANRPLGELENMIGFFINMLPIRFDLAGDINIKTLLLQVRDTFLFAHEHQHLSFEQIVQAVSPQRSPSYSPIFQVIFSWQMLNEGECDSVPAREQITHIDRYNMGSVVTAKYDLSLYMEEQSDCLIGNIEYASALFKQESIERYVAYFKRILTQMVDNAQGSIGQLDMLTTGERQQLLHGWNQTQRTYKPANRIPSLFTKQAKAHPEAIALVCGSRRLSYGELNTASNQLAHYLIEQRKVKAEDFVGIYTDRSPEMVIGMLGIMKAGGAYVPLDPAYPLSRLEFIVSDTQLNTVLSQVKWRDKVLPFSADQAVYLDDEAFLSDVRQYSDEEPDEDALGLTSDQLAYLIYTSGSTGQPKGVMIEHKNVISLLRWSEQEYGYPGLKSVLASTSMCFDLSVFELFAPLSVGGQTVIVDSILSLLDSPLETSITLINTVPSGARALLEAEGLPQGVKTINLAGEPLDTSLVNRLYALGIEQVYDLYGPSEDTTYSTFALRERDGVNTIGSPIGNTQAYVVDSHHQLVAPGVAGELLLGGAGLSRGYLHAEELTSQKFIDNPFSETPGSRLYKTGDRVRRLPNGQLVFIGRLDHQVKVRGFRIELGEIEAALCRHAQVESALVVSFEDKSGEVYLTGYYVGVDGLVEVEALRKHLSDSIPDYMHPAYLVGLDEFPLTANGKIDRKALPRPQAGVQQADYVAPTNEIERLLCTIWSDVLEVERVGIEDNFFELGGHSLLAARMMTQLQASLSLSLPLRYIFEYPTVSGFAAALAEEGEASGSQAGRIDLPPIEVSESRDSFPLAFAQSRLWFLQQIDGADKAYNIPLGYRLIGDLDQRMLRKAFEHIIERHELLRTNFVLDNGHPMQKVVPVGVARFMLKEEDLSKLVDPSQALKIRMAENAEIEFDLSCEPLIRASLFKLSDKEHILLLCLHHIIADHWSIGLLLNEFGTLYQAFTEDKPSPLMPLKVQFGDYARWQHEWFTGDIQEAHIAYWQNQLDSAPEYLSLPTDYPRPAVQEFAGGAVNLKIEGKLHTKLKQLSRDSGVSMYMTIMVAWSILMHKLSGEQDLIIGTPSANRPLKELEEVIGFFINMLAIRVDLAAASSVKHLLEQVRNTFLDAHQYQHLSFEQVVQAIKPNRSAAYSPIFQVMLSWEMAEDRVTQPQDSKLSMESYGLESTVSAKYDLSLHMEEQSDCLIGNIEYASALFKQESIERYVAYFKRILTQMVDNAQGSIGQLDMLTTGERQQLLHGWNQTQRTYKPANRIPSLFTKQAKAHPEAIALVCGSRRLSYGELNTASNQLAHYLIEQRKVKAEDFVGIYTDRSPEMVIGMLGIMKAGGAYVPLDPAYPLSRLEFIVSDTQLNTVLSQVKWRDKVLPFSADQAVYLDDEAFLSDVRQYSDEEPDEDALGLTSDQLAYLIYTSGSTGQPKGVMIEHKNVISLLRWSEQEYGYPGLKSVLASTSMCFDLSVFELFAPLSVGGQTVIVDSILSLLDSPLETSITLINTVPSGARALLEAEGLPQGVKTINLAGEPLDTSLVNRLYALGIEQVYDLYGPSEDTTYSTFALRERDGVNTIGSPIGNTQAYVVDSHHQLVAPGVAGELLLGGAGLSRGYLHAEELTSQKFIDNPFSETPGSRLYKTGDRVRRLPNGQLVFIGRLDHQVKVRGFRIELGEIEAALCRHAQVESALVVSFEDKSGEVYLTGYYVGVDGLVEVEALRKHLSDSIPDYMHPAYLVGLDEFPLTANGKIDRKALPRPQAGVQQADYVAPTNEIERLLCTIWSDVLEVERVGIEDNFFELGGHSLLAARMMTQLQASLSLSLPLRYIFEYPTVSGFAAALAEEGEASGSQAGRIDLPPIEVSESRDSFPLAFAQSRLWFHQQIKNSDRTYNIPLALSLKGPFDSDIVQAALDHIVERHELLRTNFVLVNDEPVQQVSARASFDLTLDDWSQLQNTQVRLEKAMDALANITFDLSEGPLFRGHLIKLDAQHHSLLLNIHHIIADHWSIGLLLNELRALCDAFSQKKPSPLIPLKVQFGDYARWQHEWFTGDIQEAHIAYWQDQLDGIPDLLNVATDYPRPALQDYRGGSIDLIIDQQMTEKLRKLSHKHHVSLFMTVIAAWAILLEKLSGKQDFVIGTPTSTRPVKELEEIIGFFVNMLAIRVDVSQKPTIDQLLTQVKETFLSAHEHLHLSFEQIVQAVKPARSASYSPIFQVAFSWQTSIKDNEDSHADTFNIEPLKMAGTSTAKYDLTLNVEEHENGLIGNIEYASALFKPETIERYIGYFKQILEQMVQDATQPVDAIEILKPDERQKLIYDWNNTSAPFANDKCLFELVEQHAQTRPNAMAVNHADQSLTYADLDKWANRLANFLIKEKGVGPDSLVGVCLDRSIELIVGIVAILKTGGAYVPLDPGYPPARLAYMIDDAKLDTILTHSDIGQRCSIEPSIQVCLENESLLSTLENLSEHHVARQQADIHPRKTAYMIYTSGSTGQPKGVPGHHQGVINLLSHFDRVAPVPAEENCMLCASLSFDASVYEVMNALCNGHCLHIMDENTRLDPARLFAFMQDKNVVNSFLPPAFVGEFANWVAQEGNSWPMKRLLVGVESLTMEHLQRIKTHLSGVEIINGYGPTEASICCVLYHVKEGKDLKRVMAPIGKPVSNSQIYVLDDNMSPVPQGVIGQLYIGGVVLVDGYHRNPELSDEKFVSNPFIDGDVIYKTGDLVRWLDTGDMEFIGRADEQIKIRGFRIELGEVQHALLNLNTIKDVIVMAKESPQGDKRLVAYLVAKADVMDDAEEQRALIEQVRIEMSEVLPNYMLPSVLMLLEKIPLTANGKFDKRALPEPDMTLGKEYEAPSTELEIFLCEAWQELLGGQRVGIHDNFFDLGGHSMMAAQIVAKIQDRFNIQIFILDVFNHPEPGLLAQWVSNQAVVEEPGITSFQQENDNTETESFEL
ncbi:amino acid adenylation domain-containing protein [Alteromonadaceae bacterium M269]|nr:amino acid adenylation domain-containing protein [Alteromonadaceae bacterium M269]